MLCGSNGLWNVQYLVATGQVWAGTRQVTCSTAQHGPACPHPLHTAAFLHPPPLHPARSNSYTTAGRGGYSAWYTFKKVQYLLRKSINLSSFTESSSMFDIANRTVCTPRPRLVRTDKCFVSFSTCNPNTCSHWLTQSQKEADIYYLFIIG